MKDEIKEILDKLNSGVWEKDEQEISYKILFSNEVYQLLYYITNLQEENNKLKNLEYKFFYCSEDEESFTLEDYLQLGNKLYDLEEENKKIKNKLEDEKKNYKRITTYLQEENERLKEENKHIFANVNDDQLLRSNAMNYAELQDYKTRNEKAIEYVNTHKPSDTISFPLMKKDEENQVKSCFDYEFREIYQKELLEILQEKSDENE